VSTILDALRRLQREQEAAGAERELRDTVTTEIPLPEERRTSRAPLWLVGLGLLLLAVGVSGYWWMGRRGAPHAEPAPEVVARTQETPPASRLPRRTHPVVPAQPAPAPPPAPQAAPVPPPMPPAPAPPPASAPVPAPAPVQPVPPPAAAPVPAPSPPPAPPAPVPSAAPAPGASPPAPAPSPPLAAAPVPAQPSAPPEPAARPARISPVRVDAPQEAQASAPAPAAPVAPRPASTPAAPPAEKKSAAPARTAEPARAPERRAEPEAPVELPDIRVTQLRWHPEARRRSASLQLAMRQIEDAREGDVVEGLVLEEILPDAVVMRAGKALHRIALQP
jgi:hypothetical protein